MARAHVNLITFEEVDELLVQLGRSQTIVQFSQRVFDGHHASIVLFFQSLLSQSVFIASHHKPFFYALIRELGEFDETDLNYVFLKALYDGAHAEQLTMPPPDPSPGQSTLRIHVQLVNGRMAAPCYIERVVAVVFLGRLMISPYLVASIGSLGQLPYTLVSALLSTRNTTAQAFVRNVLFTDQARSDPLLTKQLDSGNLLCHYYREELLRLNLEALPLAPPPVPLNTAELCTSINSQRLLVTLYDYFEYRISDLLYAEGSDIVDPRRLRSTFFSLLLTMLRGLPLADGDDDNAWTEWIRLCAPAIRPLLERHADIAKRTLQVSREFAKFVIVADARQRQQPEPPRDWPLGWNDGYENPVSEVLANSKSVDANYYHLQRFRPSQTMLEHLYAQSVSISAQITAYESTYAATMNDRFVWNWNPVQYTTTRILMALLVSSMQFIQARRLYEFLGSASTAVPFIVVQFPSTTRACDVEATMLTYTQRHAAILTKRNGATVAMDPYMVVPENGSAYLVLTERSCELLRNLSLIDWLSKMGDVSKPVCVSPLLMRLYATQPEHMGLYAVVRVMCAWLGIDTLRRPHHNHGGESLLSSDVLDVNHEMFGCYRWIHMIPFMWWRSQLFERALTDKQLFTKLTDCMSSFLCIQRVHFLFYDAGYNLLRHWFWPLQAKVVVATETGVEPSPEQEEAKRLVDKHYFACEYIRRVLDIHRQFCERDAERERKRHNAVFTPRQIAAPNGKHVVCDLTAIDSSFLADCRWRGLDPKEPSRWIPFVNRYIYELIFSGDLPDELSFELLCGFDIRIPVVDSSNSDSSSSSEDEKKKPPYWRNNKNGESQLYERMYVKDAGKKISAAELLRGHKGTVRESKHKKHDDGIRRLYRGIKDANIIAHMPTLGIRQQPSKEPHPSRLFRYDIDEELRQQPLDLLYRYLIAAESRTYISEAKDHRHPPIGCNWSNSMFSWHMMDEDVSWLNADIPIAVNYIDRPDKDSIDGVLFFYDYAFLIKVPKLQASPSLAMPVREELGSPQPKRKHAAVLGQRMGPNLQREQALDMTPYAEVLDVVFKFTGELDVASILRQYGSGQERIPVHDQLTTTSGVSLQTSVDSPEKQQNQKSALRTSRLFEKVDAAARYTQTHAKAPAIEGLVIDEYGGFL